MRYLKTIKDGLRTFCPSCRANRPVYVVEDDAGSTMTCCCTCQFVIARKPTVKEDTNG